MGSPDPMHMQTVQINLACLNRLLVKEKLILDLHILKNPVYTSFKIMF